MQRYAVAGAIIGFAIPYILWALEGIGETYGLWLWPSSILLLLTDGRENAPISWFIVSFSILINVALYSVYGLGLFGLSSLCRRLQHRA